MKIGAFFLTLILGAIIWWGLGFLKPIDRFNDNSHHQIIEWFFESTVDSGSDSSAGESPGATTEPGAGENSSTQE